MSSMLNPNPTIHTSQISRTPLRLDEKNHITEINADTIFELIRDIKDPEHPNTLEDLNVVCKEDIIVDVINEENYLKHLKSKDCPRNDKLLKMCLPMKYIKVKFTPTIAYCSMASVIGLCIKVQLSKYVKDCIIDVVIAGESHVAAIDLNKQLADKDRVFAAMENEGILDVVNACLPETPPIANN